MRRVAFRDSTPPRVVASKKRTRTYIDDDIEFYEAKRQLQLHIKKDQSAAVDSGGSLLLAFLSSDEDEWVSPTSYTNKNKKGLFPAPAESELFSASAAPSRAFRGRRA